MNSPRRFGAFSSSENPEQLGSTVKAFILGVGVLVVFAVNAIFHIQWTAENLNQFATDAGALAASIWFAYGLVKKAAVWLIDRWNNRNNPDVI